MVQISVALSVPFSAHRTSIDFCRNLVCEANAECVMEICTADKKKRKKNLLVWIHCPSQKYTTAGVDTSYLLYALKKERPSLSSLTKNILCGVAGYGFP